MYIVGSECEGGVSSVGGVETDIQVVLDLGESNGWVDALDAL